VTAKPQDLVHVCPDCGAENPAGSPRCWLCRGPLEVQGKPATAARPRARTVVGLGFWVLLLALVVVCVGAMMEYPGLGILVAVVGTPALLFLLRIAQPGSGMERASGLLATAGAVMALVVAAIIAFVAVCFPVGFGGFAVGFEQSGSRGAWGGFLMIAAWPLGIAAGVAVAWFLARQLWPRSRQP
jgi:hypothetical protein